MNKISFVRSKISVHVLRREESTCNMSHEQNPAHKISTNNDQPTTGFSIHEEKNQHATGFAKKISRQQVPGTKISTHKFHEQNQF